jgi:hypothetical protein
LIVPKSSGCSLKRPENAEAETIQLIDHHGKMNPAFIDTLRTIFYKLDLINGNKIFYPEFNGLLEMLGLPLLKDEQ